MRKSYAAYLVVMTALCLIGLWGVVRVVEDGQAKIAAIRAESQTIERTVADLDALIEARQSALEAANARHEALAQAARIKAAMDAEAARINAQEAARPKPAPVTGYAPGNRVAGRVYSNTSIRPARRPPTALPDVEGPRLVIEVDPRYGTAELERLTRDKRLTCAAFSYRPEPGVTRNRVYCAQKGS